MHKASLEGKLSVLADSLESGKSRNYLYRCFVQAEYGILGSGIYIHIPVCVVDFIHTICTSTDGSYTGYCKTGDNNRVKDADDSSVEDADIKLGP